MSKNKFMKNVKRTAYNEMKNYQKDMGLLYDIFHNEDQITDNDNKVFEYITSEMTPAELNELFKTIIVKLGRLDIIESNQFTLIFKFLIVSFITNIIGDELNGE